MKMFGVKITGIGMAVPGYDGVPGRIMTNDMIAKELFDRGMARANKRGLLEERSDRQMDEKRLRELSAHMKNYTTSDAWIRERSFIERRSFADSSIATSDLAAIAAGRALECAGLRRDAIERIDLATVSPDHLASPPTVAIVAEKLGLHGIRSGEIGMLFGADTTLACSSFVAALINAYNAIATGMCKNAVVIGADVMSRLVSPDDRGFYVLLGDGAGAMVLEQCDEAESSFDPQGFCGGLDGRFANRILTPLGGTRLVKPETDENGKQWYDRASGIPFTDKLWMDGKAVFKEIIQLIYSEKNPDESVIGRALARAKKTLADIDFMAFHQANLRMIQLVIPKLVEHGFDGAVLNNIDRYGNTTSATIPLILAEAHRDGMLLPGDTFMGTVFGGGYSWGTVIGKWTVNE